MVKILWLYLLTLAFYKFAIKASSSGPSFKWGLKGHIVGMQGWGGYISDYSSLHWALSRLDSTLNLTSGVE